MKELICKNCGAQLIRESGSGFACPNCGTRYTESDESGAVVNNVLNTHITKIVNGREVDEAAEFISRSRNRLDMNDFDAAEEIAAEGLEYYPENVGLMMCIVRSRTKNYTKFFDTTHLEYLDRAYAAANAEERLAIEKEYEIFCQRRKDAGMNDANKAPKQSVPVLAIIISIIIVVLIFILR